MGETAKLSKFMWAIFFVAALLAPVIFNYDKYLLHVGISISFNIALATSMWLIWSLGFVSFAHAGFMGIGAYTSAILFTKLGWSLFATIWVAAGVGALIAVIVSIPLMLTRAVYFFMASWAVGEVIKRIFAYYRKFFGGWDGIFDIAPPKLDFLGIHIDFSSRVAYYYLALLFCAAIVLIIYRINKSRTGTIYWSIHDGELLAQHLGINILKHKVIAFTLACLFAAVIGALYAHYHTYINPKTFDIWQSEFSLVHCIVGGLSTVAGPVLGAGILTIVDELLRPAGYYRVIFFGVILILTVLFMPGGLETIPDKIRSLYRKLVKDGKEVKVDEIT